MNKGTLRVNCPASEWPLPLTHSNEQEQVIIFLSKVTPSPDRHVNTAECEVHGVKISSIKPK